MLSVFYETIVNLIIKLQLFKGFNYEIHTFFYYNYLLFQTWFWIIDIWKHTVYTFSVEIIKTFSVCVNFVHLFVNVCEDVVVWITLSPSHTQNALQAWFSPHQDTGLLPEFRYETERWCTAKCVSYTCTSLFRQMDRCCNGHLLLPTSYIR